jgi:RimJ/RimL family protein N-acetyltransferase
MIPILKTERLILRPFSPSDAPDVQRLAGDSAVSDMTINIPHPYRDGMAEKWISGHQKEFASGQGVTLAITSKKERYLIGAIGLREITKDRQATLGYWIGKPFWNQGFCTEAGQAILEYAFTELSLNCIRASHLSCNPASGRVMQKLRMRYEGTQRRRVVKWGRDEDFEFYILSRTDWRNPAANH